MKKALFAISALLASTALANAADLAAKPYKAAPYVAPAYNWNGFYIGGFGGYGWSDSQGVDFTGGFGGGNIGYNWQFAPNWLIGIEGEGAGADIGQTASFLGQPVATTKINSFASITGRLGWTANEWLVYAKGGYGWVDNKLTVLGVSDSQTHNGYVIGGGVEWGFAPNWSAKVEYLLYHADSKNYFGNIVPGGLASGDFDINTVKFGVNYRFGWAAARY